MQLISENMVQSTFPNVLTTLKIHRCLYIINDHKTISLGERGIFSKLKILKNCHRASLSESLTQERLNSLAIMATEYDVLEHIDF